MHPIIQSPHDRQLILGSGIRVQSAGYTTGGVVSQYAVGFDGSNDYVTTMTNIGNFAIADPFTVCAWIKTNTALSTERPIVGNSALGPGWLFRVTTANKIRFSMVTNGFTYSGMDSAAITSNWTFVCGVHEGNGVVRVYLNGSESSITPITSGTVTTITTAATVGIGKVTDWNEFFSGLIDDIRIYNRALTAAEISSIYANIASPPTSGLVAYFPLEEGTGTTTTDEIAGLTGTLTNGPTWSTDVPAAIQ